MAKSLQQAFQQLQQMAEQVDSQAQQEHSADPLYDTSLTKLDSVSCNVENASVKLAEEETLFSESVDMSTYEAEELNKMASDVREASRKLSIVLAAGSNHFQGQTRGDLETIKGLHSYIAPDIMNKLDTSILQQVIGTRSCPHGHQMQACPYGCGNAYNRSGCAANQISLTPSNDFRPCATSAETIDKISDHLKEMAKKFDKISEVRNQSRKDKAGKEHVKKTLTKNIGALVPMLRRHVLRVGIAKGKHLNISTGCANVSTLTQMFSYVEVEDAHRQLEDCRDRIMQELTLRKLEVKLNKKSHEKSRT